MVEGPKGQILLTKFQLQTEIQIFFNQTLYVFSQRKDIKHMRPDFHSVAWVMPQGVGLGGYRGVEGSIFFSPEIQPNLLCELLT